MTLRSPSTVFIKPFAKLFIDPRVHQAVSRPAVESPRGLVFLKDGDIGNATNIQDHAYFDQRPKHAIMKRGHQRCALTSGSNVAGAKVGHNVDAGQLGQSSRIIQLYREAQIGPVPHCLAVTPNRDDIFGGSASVFEEFCDGSRVDIGQCVGSYMAAFNFIRANDVQRQQLSA